MGVLVDVLDEVFHVLEVLPGIIESKITAPWKSVMTTSMSWRHFRVNIIHKLNHLVLSIETFESWVSLKCIIVVYLEVRNPAVMILEKRGQYLLLGTEVLGKWSPDELHCVFLDSLLFIKSVQTGKELSFKTHISEQSSISARMSK